MGDYNLSADVGQGGSGSVQLPAGDVTGVPSPQPAPGTDVNYTIWVSDIPPPGNVSPAVTYTKKVRRQLAIQALVPQDT